MSTFLLLIFLPLTFQLTPDSPFFRGFQSNTGSDESKPWYDQPLCVLQASSSCPTGFSFEELRLSVQPDVNPKDKNIAGESLMHLGEAGSSSLVYDTYDRLYTLSLTICCKK